MHAPGEAERDCGGPEGGVAGETAVKTERARTVEPPMPRERPAWAAAGALALASVLWAACSPQDGTVAPPDLSWLATAGRGSPNVREFPSPWIDGCGSGCSNAYLDFIRRHRRPHGRAVAEEDLEAEVRAMAVARPPERVGLQRRELRDELVRRLNIGFLLDGGHQRGLAVSVLGERRRPGFLQRKLLFWDPEVGSFEGSLLLPAHAGARPGIIALHGHRDTDESFIDEFPAAQLALEGFVVLLPRFRAMDCSVEEAAIARELLRNGFTLMGLRVYEVLLMKKYLQQLPQVRPDRLGIIGHSGGSAVASLVVWIDDGFRAQAGDHRTDFRDECRHGRWHCETIPGLFPLSADINHLETLPLPFHGSHYRFQEGARPIVEFFRERIEGYSGGTPAEEEGP